MIIRLLKIYTLRVKRGISMEISSQKIEGATHIIINVDRLDVVNALDVKTAVATKIAGHDNIIFDLSYINFIDSSGLSMIINIYKSVISMGGSFKLCGLSDQAKELMEITQMHQLFDILENCPKA